MTKAIRIHVNGGPDVMCFEEIELHLRGHLLGQELLQPRFEQCLGAGHVQVAEDGKDALSVEGRALLDPDRQRPSQLITGCTCPNCFFPFNLPGVPNIPEVRQP